MQYEDTVRIGTPEGVELEFALAGIGSRLAARLLDHLIQAAVAFGVLLLSIAGLDDSSLAAGIVTAIGIVVGFLVFWGYDVLFEAFAAGRTPGKRALGIRVVGERGEPVSFSMAAVRNLLRIVDEYLTLWIAALVSIVRSRQNQRLGDIAAGAIVVKDRPVEHPGDAHVSPWARGTLPAAAAWDTTAITVDELTAARRFLERRYSLNPLARAQLAHGIAGRLAPKVPGANARSAEEFLELLVAVKGQRG